MNDELCETTGLPKDECALCRLEAERKPPPLPEPDVRSVYVERGPGWGVAIILGLLLAAIIASPFFVACVQALRDTYYNTPR